MRRTPSQVHDRRVTTDARTTLLLLRSLLYGERMERVDVRVEHTLTNAKDVPARVELRQSADRIRGSSHPWTRENGTPTWRLDLPAQSTTVLSYRARQEDE